MINESNAFILHRHTYGETSRIMRCFTRDYGRVDMLCRGCRKSGKQPRNLEPFRRYHFSWSGKGELKTLRQSDELGLYPISSVAEKLYCGFYMNELLSQVIRAGEAEPDMFDLYAMTLSRLTENDVSKIQVQLRSFELSLLQVMGYGLSLDVEKDGVTPIAPSLDYGYEPDHGLYQSRVQHNTLARGDSIIALSNGRFENSRQESEAKRLMRFIIGYYLPNSSIQSRKLFA